MSVNDCLGCQARPIANRLRIKCAVCHKAKAPNFFSTAQQLELQNGIATGQVGNATVEGWVPCYSCTPKQVTELQCCICEEVKGLDGFAKAQRRLGENAVCKHRSSAPNLLRMRLTTAIEVHHLCDDVEWRDSCRRQLS